MTAVLLKRGNLDPDTRGIRLHKVKAGTGVRNAKDGQQAPRSKERARFSFCLRRYALTLTHDTHT